MQSGLNNYVSYIIRRGDLRVLSKYIPETLFIETDLPSVVVCNDPYLPLLCTNNERNNRNICVSRNCTNKEIIDAPLALSVYLPGRPLYRISSMGTFIPVRSPRNDRIGDAFTLLNYRRCINGFENYDLLPIQVSLGKIDIPEELLAFIELYLESSSSSSHISRFLKKYRIRKVYTYPFESENCNHNKVLHWISYYNGGTKSFIFDNYQLSKRQGLIRFVKKESISYSRLFNKLGSWEENSDAIEKLYNEIIVKLIKDEGDYEIIEIGQNADIHRFAYAIDQYIKQFVIKYDEQNNINIELKNEIENCKGLSLKEYNDILRHRRRSTWSQTLYREKVLGIKDGNDHYYVAVIGYKIEKTNYLTLKLKRFFNEFFRNLESFEKRFEEVKREYMRIINSNKKPSGNMIYDLYKYWTVNSVLYNIAKYYIAHDLVVNTIIQCPQLRTLVDLSFAFNDMYNVRKITDMIKEMNLDEILDVIINYNDNIIISSDSFDLTKYVFGLIFSGERLPSCSNIRSTNTDLLIEIRNKLKERLDKLIAHIRRYINTREPYYGFLAFVLLHTLNHHLLKKISQRSSIPINYLSEILSDIHSYRMNAFVFENISGGIKAIETYIEKIVANKSLFLNDLLSMGMCVIGSAEDILYFSSIMGKDITNIEYKDISDTISYLRIIILNEELEEVEKLITSIKENALALSKLINKPYESILNEILMARRDLEANIMRFSYPDELFIFILKHIHKYRILKELLQELTKRYLLVKEVPRSLLSRIYRTNDVGIIAEKLIDDIAEILNYNTNNGLTNLLKSPNRVERNNARNVIIDVSRIGKNALIKLFLQTCISSCTYCYIDTFSCSRYTAPFIQGLTLNRRLLKLFATWFVLNKLYTVSSDKILEKFGQIIGAVNIGNEKLFIVEVENNE